MSWAESKLSETELNRTKKVVPDMVTTHFLFNLNHLKKFWLDSTHDSQWLYKNWFVSPHGTKWISEIWFKSTHDSKSFRIFWFKSTRDSKRLSRIDSNRLMTKKTLEYWFESTVDFVEPFRTFTQFCWPFWGISRNSLTFFRLSLNFVDLFWAFIKCLDSNQLMTRAVSRKTWIDSTNDSNGFPGVDSESTHDSSGFPRWWFRLTHDSKRFPFFFRFKSAHDSSEKHLTLKSTHDSTLSHTYVWVVPMSGRVSVTSAVWVWHQLREHQKTVKMSVFSKNIRPIRRCAY